MRPTKLFPDPWPSETKTINACCLKLLIFFFKEREKESVRSSLHTPHYPSWPLPDTLFWPSAIHYLPNDPLPTDTSTISLYSNHTKLPNPDILSFYTFAHSSFCLVDSFIASLCILPQDT